MSDPTTEGYTVNAAEIEGMVRNLCAYALSEPDPLQRYADLTHQQVLFDGIVAAIQRARGRAVADLVVSGMPVEQVAAKTNLATVPRVRKLISVAGETERVKAAAAAAKPKKAKGAPAAEPAPAPTPVPEPVPVAVTGKRMLTPAEREALGLPPAEPQPRSRPPKRRRWVQSAAGR
ncbi:hypothetical protein [Catellatospora chokoriensis]|uniref:Uncharacterized protein n=1 Tax=Catellatospora chokoriensis TaxID=310353 RepID=A0A8J3NPS8_9ACTN|nr:hypothetical protein [Catellatospora chokoriensis]GIF88225.1 hypothetical protein Cch02nite_16690 [Catellatospora chokoriensis]